MHMSAALISSYNYMENQRTPATLIRSYDTTYLRVPQANMLGARFQGTKLIVREHDVLDEVDLGKRDQGEGTILSQLADHLDPYERLCPRDLAVVS